MHTFQISTDIYTNWKDEVYTFL